MQRVWIAVDGNNQRIMDILRPHIHVGFMKNEQTHLSATGIPPHIMLAESFHEQATKQQAQIDELRDIMKSIPKDSCDEILSRCQVGGAIPISKQQLDGMMEDIKSYFNEKMVSPSLNVTSSASLITLPHGQGQTFNWNDGKLHYVPKGYKFPQELTCLALWNRWWDHDPATKILPFRFLKPSIEFPRDSWKFCKAKSVIELIEENGRTALRIPSSIKTYEAPLQLRDKIFQEGFKEVCKLSYPNATVSDQDVKRIGDRSYTTIYSNYHDPLRNNKRSRGSK